VATLLFVECATYAVALAFYDWLVRDSILGIVATLCSAAVLIGTGAPYTSCLSKPPANPKVVRLHRGCESDASGKVRQHFSG
jgi:hypothetical protein